MGFPVPRRGLAPLVAALVVPAVLACGPPRLDAVPEDLLGIWKTEGARYERRYLEIRPSEFILGINRTPFERLEIQQIDHETGQDGGSLYRLHYVADEGYDDTLELRLQLEPEPTLHVGGIPYPWNRVDSY